MIMKNSIFNKVVATLSLISVLSGGIVSASESALNTPEGLLLENLVGMTGGQADYSKFARAAFIQYSEHKNLDPNLALENLKNAANEMGIGGPEFDQTLEQVQSSFSNKNFTQEKLNSDLNQIVSQLHQRQGAQLASNGNKCTVPALIGQVSAVAFIGGFFTSLFTGNPDHAKVAWLGAGGMVLSWFTRGVFCK
jgi:hypothetical protein